MQGRKRGRKYERKREKLEGREEENMDVRKEQKETKLWKKDKEEEGKKKMREEKGNEGVSQVIYKSKLPFCNLLFRSSSLPSFLSFLLSLLLSSLGNKLHHYIPYL